MDTTNKIFIVIPAYNEAQRIGQVLRDLQQYAYQVVVVDDGSTDNTARQVNKFNQVHLVHHFINCGMGAALQTGNQYALAHGAEVIVHFDADGQMQVAEIDDMIQPLINGQADMCMGSRFLSKQSQVPWLKKYLLLKPARLLNWLMTGLWLSDAHNGFRALTAQAARKIYIHQDRMAHATEILQHIKAHKLKYKEVPVTITYHEFGQNFWGGLKILRDLIIKRG